MGVVFETLHIPGKHCAAVPRISQVKFQTVKVTMLAALDPHRPVMKPVTLGAVQNCLWHTCLTLFTPAVTVFHKSCRSY